MVTMNCLQKILLIFVALINCSQSYDDFKLKLKGNKTFPLVLLSEGYPEFITPRDPFTWSLSAPEDSAANLICADFRIQEVPNCKGNTVLIGESGTSFERDLCKVNSFASFSSEGFISIKLQTNTSIPVRYNCTFYLSPTSLNRHIPVEETSCPCGRTVKVKTGVVNVILWDFQVFLRSQDLGIFCSGSILTPRYILTAAHYLADKAKARIEVIVFSVNGGLTSESQVVIVKNSNIHPDYNPVTTSSDIAVLELAKDITFSSWLRPVCLLSKKAKPYSLVDQWVKALGYGNLSDAGQYAPMNITQEVNLVGVDNENCKQVYPDKFNMTNRSQLCAIAAYGYNHKCDIEGPLVYIDPAINRYVQVGITSYGAECSKGKPTIYTDIHAHMSWIESIIRKKWFGPKICKKMP